MGSNLKKIRSLNLNTKILSIGLILSVGFLGYFLLNIWLEESYSSKKIKFELSERDLSYWSEKDQCWKVEPAEYIFEVGSSAKEIKDSASVWLG